MKKFICLFFMISIVFFVCSCGKSSEEAHLTEISSNKVSDSILQKLDNEGIYMIQNEEDCIIVLRKNNKQSYESSGRIDKNNIIISYEDSEDIGDNDVIYEKIYWIDSRTINNDTTIKVYMNNEETFFTNRILTDEQIIK